VRRDDVSDSPQISKSLLRVSQNLITDQPAISRSKTPLLGVLITCLAGYRVYRRDGRREFEIVDDFSFMPRVPKHSQAFFSNLPSDRFSNSVIKIYLYKDEQGITSESEHSFQPCRRGLSRVILNDKHKT
jgi:hypothetical protein